MKKKSILTSFLLAAVLVTSLPAGAQLKRGLQATGTPTSTLSIQSPNRVWTYDDGEISVDTGADMNGDDVLDIRDFYIADRFISYYILNGISDIIADRNGDGEVTIADIGYVGSEVNSKFKEQGHLYNEVVVTSQADGIYDVSIVFNVWNPNIAGLQYGVVLPSQIVSSSYWYSRSYDYHYDSGFRAGLHADRTSDSSERFLNLSLKAFYGDYEDECYPQGVYEDMYLMFDPDHFGYYDNLGTIRLIDVRAIDDAGNLHMQGDGFTIALSSDVFEVNGVYYRAFGGQVKVLRHPDGYSGTVTIPEVFWDGPKRYTVTSIGDYAFYKCFQSGLRNVIIGDSVISIGDHAFESSGLRSLTIGKSVKRIGSMAFSQTYFSSVICKAVTPPSCPYDALVDPYYDPDYNPTLYVPAESVEAYKSTFPWSRFSKIVGGMPKLGDVDGDDNVDVADVVAQIDYVLGGSSTSFNSDNADVTWDGRIDVSDVVDLINYLLQGTW